MFSYEKFRALCDERKVTPYQVSKGTSNVSTVTLSDWKNGKCGKLYLLNIDLFVLYIL